MRYFRNERQKRNLKATYLKKKQSKISFLYTLNKTSRNLWSETIGLIWILLEYMDKGTQTKLMIQLKLTIFAGIGKLYFILFSFVFSILSF